MATYLQSTFPSLPCSLGWLHNSILANEMSVEVMCAPFCTASKRSGLPSTSFSTYRLENGWSDAESHERGLSTKVEWSNKKDTTWVSDELIDKNHLAHFVCQPGQIFAGKGSRYHWTSILTQSFFLILLYSMCAYTCICGHMCLQVTWCTTDNLNIIPQVRWLK